MKFDGYDAIIDDEGEVVYDGLDSRSADLILRHMNQVERLEDLVTNLELEKLSAETVANSIHQMQEKCIKALQAEVVAKDARIERLQAELAAAKAENATLAGLALDATNIFSYTAAVLYRIRCAAIQSTVQPVG